MKPSLTLIILLVLASISVRGQLYQYFDGADTIPDYSLPVHLDTVDTSSTNIWQIGMPHRSIFDSAATFPNVIVTDTSNFYPVGNTSTFRMSVTYAWWTWGIMALQWKQKLDMDTAVDGGIIEFSVDSGNSWHNAFDNPFVYAFYGFDSTNVDTLPSGEVAFTGTDSTWRDVWLCFDMSWIAHDNDTLWFKFKFTSDSVDNGKEGWMMDNFIAHITLLHTINETKQPDYLNLFPNPSSGRVFIEARKVDGFHIIKSIEVFNAQGAEVRRLGIAPTKFFIDLDDLPTGAYFVKVTTNLQSQTFKIVLE